jgi:hypothetical protein
MSKAMFGIAATVALAMSSAWAGDEKSDEKATGDTVASRESRKVSHDETAAGNIVEVASDRRVMTESKEVRASHDERWLREREGYRDGGY